MDESRSDQLFAAFAAFHRENPTVWEAFQRFTKAALAAGLQHYSANAIFERIRYHLEIEIRTTGKLKLNNNYRCFYARLFHAAYPEHAGFFRNRQRISEGKPPADVDNQEWIAPPATDEARMRDRLLALIQ